MGFEIRLTWNCILKSRNARSGRGLNEYSVCEYVDSADIESNIESRTARIGGRFPQYSMGESIDQANTESHIEIPQCSEWPKIKRIFSG